MIAPPDDLRDPAHTPGPLETVYDEQLAARVTELISICRAHGIPLHLSFALDGALNVVTHICEPDKVAPQNARGVMAWDHRYRPIAESLAGTHALPIAAVLAAMAAAFGPRTP